MRLVVSAVEDAQSVGACQVFVPRLWNAEGAIEKVFRQQGIYRSLHHHELIRVALDKIAYEVRLWI